MFKKRVRLTSQVAIMKLTFEFLIFRKISNRSFNDFILFFNVSCTEAEISCKGVMFSQTQRVLVTMHHSLFIIFTICITFLHFLVRQQPVEGCQNRHKMAHNSL